MASVLATVFIVHRRDGLLRALAGLLVQERYRVESADGIEAFRDELTAVDRPALLLIDEDSAGPGWREQLERVPGDVARVLLTWTPAAPVPPGVTPIGKPFRARELLDALAEKVAPLGSDAAGAP